MTARVDVLVPIHSETRPFSRLLDTVLTNGDVRVIAVAHNIDPELISRAAGRWREDDRVEVVPFSDGVNSPAGPLSLALSRVTAPFFTKVDSDDYLVPRAIDEWVSTQQRTKADIVLPVMRQEGSATSFPTPPTRPGRRHRLDPVLDRLAYRSSTMGLIRSELVEHALPTAGISTGEDIVPSLRLWFSGARIARAGASSRYIVGGTAVDRVTADDRSMADELAFLQPLVGQQWLMELPAQARTAIALKLTRVQLFDAMARRADRDWSGPELTVLQSAVAALTTISGSFQAELSRVDGSIVRGITEGAPVADIRALVRTRRRYLRPDALLTASLVDVLHRDAPLRFLAASVLAARTR